MADMPGVVLRHRGTKEFIVLVDENGRLRTTTQKGEAKWFSGLNSVDKFIKYEDLEEECIPTPFTIDLD